MKLLSVTELKARAGKVLDRARAGQAQFVVRRGDVLQISKTTVLAGIEERPPGYFDSDYSNPDQERLKLERAMARQRQIPER